MSPLGTPENPDENANSKHSAAVATGNSPLDPQLQLLIEAWPTLSKAVQQQIMRMLEG